MDIMQHDTAKQIAARIWCDPEYSHVPMNSMLVIEIAGLLQAEANKNIFGWQLFARWPSRLYKYFAEKIHNSRKEAG